MPFPQSLYRQCEPMVQGNTRYFLTVSKIGLPSWKQFVRACVGVPATLATNCIKCFTCTSTWNKLRTLAVVRNGTVQSAFFGQDEEYEEDVWPAILFYQQAFSNAVVTHNIVTEADDRDTIGYVERGLFLHIHLKCDLYAHQELKSTVAQYVPQLLRYVKEWDLNDIQQIIQYFEDKGEEVSAYRHIYRSLVWFRDLLAKIVTMQGEIVTATIIDEIVKIGSERPEVVGSILHTFSNSSNLALCRKCSNTDAFWKEFNERYNPETYRQKTVEATESNIEMTLKRLNIPLSSFERAEIALTDRRFIDVCWYHVGHYVRRKNVLLKKTVFSDKITEEMSIGEFEDWLSSSRERIEGIKILTLNSITPCIFGIPQTALGFEMTKRLCGWGVTTKPVPCTSVGVPSNSWIDIKAIAPHPGRWLKDGNLSSHERSLVADGFVVIHSHKYNPLCSCLFSEFFNEKYHNIDRIIHTLHNKLRVRYTPNGIRGSMYSTVNGRLLQDVTFKMTFIDTNVEQTIRVI